MPFRIRTFLSTIAISIYQILQGNPAFTQGYEYVGQGRLFSNDLFGDGDDRWRTGAYSLSFLWGRVGQDKVQRRPGEVIELRLRSELITPESLTNPDPDDRRYAGMLSAGLHTHFRQQAVEGRLGLDLVVTGPQTRLDRLQTRTHRLVGLPLPSDAVLDAQIADGFHPTLSGDLAWQTQLSDTMRLRPFAEWQVGVEWLVRMGADLIIGDFGREGFMLRDPSVGQLYTAGDGARGLSLIAGADTAYVGRSVLLPGDQLRRDRHRARIGLSWRGKRTRAFYGATWLSPEFTGQSGSQIVGSVKLGFTF